METLLAITTYNQIEYTLKCLDSIDNAGIDADVVIFDDASTDGTAGLTRARVVTKPEGRGLTDSWNMAYRYFKNNGYKYFFLLNNDILIPRGAIENMIADIGDAYVIAPMTTLHGARGVQVVNSYHGVDKPDNPENYQRIQDSLSNIPPHPIARFNGFAFGMTRKIIEFERPDGNLFDPQKINVGNEDELNDRILRAGHKPLLCLRAFIFHFKDKTFNRAVHKVDRENLQYYRNI